MILSLMTFGIIIDVITLGKRKTCRCRQVKSNDESYNEQKDSFGRHDGTNLSNLGVTERRVCVKCKHWREQEWLTYFQTLPSRIPTAFTHHKHVVCTDLRNSVVTQAAALQDIVLHVNQSVNHAQENGVTLPSS